VATPELYVFDEALSVVRVPLAPLLSQGIAYARGVRWMPDGTLLVAASVAEGSWYTGKLLRFDRSGAFDREIVSMPVGRTHPAGLVLHPDGVHAYVGTETRYTPSVCCGESFVFDLGRGVASTVSDFESSRPSFAIVRAVVLPYPPAFVFAGQSDSGNDVYGAIVDITSASVPKVVPTPTNLGTITGLATPFGRRL
jgi:hypothetical protein